MNPVNYLRVRKRKGFTLIELLIVISILVILSVAVAMNFIGFDYDARHSSTKSNLAAIRSAISLFRSRHSSFPNPSISGGRKATQQGEETLEAILTATNDHGDKTEYIRGNIAGELISSSKERSYVCVVKTAVEFYADQSLGDSCLNPTSEDDEKDGGYVYCTATGSIRLNFSVDGDDLRKNEQKSLGSLFSEWLTWQESKKDSEKDWPVKW